MAEHSSFHMIDVTEKAVTRRRALAQGRISMSANTLQRIRERRMPKGDVLAMAEVSGISAAKRTSDLLPLCHPLSLDAVKVSCAFSDKRSITVTCEAITSAKTGVEMEALTGVSAALLAIYDLTKGVDPALTLSDIRLVRKEGGKSGLWLHPELPERSEEERPSVTQTLANMHAKVLTISDRCSRGEANDTSGPKLKAMLEQKGAKVLDTATVPDDETHIRRVVSQWAESQQTDMIITTGGTGLGPRDVTVATLSKLFTKPVPGIGELLRRKGAEETERSWLSGSVGGLIGRTLVIALPGKPQAVETGINALEGILSHAVLMIHGGGHP